MKAHDIPTALAKMTAAAFTQLMPFNGGGIYLCRFSGKTPWERHPNGDELLHVLDGEVQVTVRDGEKPVQVTLRAGSVFVVPRGRWHRQDTPGGVALLSATPTPTHMSAEDPPTTNAKHPRTRQRAPSRRRSQPR